MKRPSLKILSLLTVATAVAAIAGCASESSSDLTAELTSQAEVGPVKKTYEDLIVGFSQIGAESEWRTANTISIKSEAERLGVELRFSDAQQQQENQIKAIRSFIAQQVDVIGVSPVVETGWESVFQEAKEAGIPIILVDRRADVVEEGRNAARVMADLLDSQGRIAELVGTVDSAPANDRYHGFREVLKDYPEMRIIASKSGDFTAAKGREVMEEFLQIYDGDIDALYAHNDDMAIGAIKAIEAYGLKPGEDIKIVSIDAARVAFEAMLAGKLNATVECNPLLGPQFFDLALKVVNGEDVPKRIKSEESIFFPDNAAEVMATRIY